MDNPFTLNKLIDKCLELREQGYGELPVESEGCDCNGSAGTIEVCYKWEFGKENKDKPLCVLVMRS